MSFLPTSTAFSANCAADLFHPAASHGVRAVSVVASHLLCFHNSWSSTPSSGSLIIPFKAFPSPIAALRHRRRCLLVVGLHICFQCASLDLKALLHRRVRCPLVMSPSPDFSMLSWALFPFKALPSFRLPIWTSPESFRLSGTTLGHVHRSGRALNVAAAEATA